MLQFETLVPALGATGQQHFHAWWIIIAAAVFMLVAPLAYLLSRGGGQSG